MANPLHPNIPSEHTSDVDASGQPVAVPEASLPRQHPTSLASVTATGAPTSSIRARLANLAAAIDGTRTRTTLDMRKLLLGLGISLITLGMLDTLLGWYGAAHSPYLFQEIPYLISGGLLGVCLVIAGGSLFVAGWIVRVLHENRRHTVVLARTIDRLERTLRAMSPPQANGNAGDSTSEVTVPPPRKSAPFPVAAEERTEMSR